MPARPDPRTEKSRKPLSAPLRAVLSKSAKKKSGGKVIKTTASPAKSAKAKVVALPATKPAKLKVSFSSAPKPNGAHPSKGVLKNSNRRNVAATAFTPTSKRASSTEPRTNGSSAGGKSSVNGSAKSGAKVTPIVITSGYRPNESEPFMNERQRTYFRAKLLAWKEDIVRQNQETLTGLHEDSAQYADVADRATSETDRALELRARDRQRKLMGKIDAALSRLDDGSYGYCEETGEPISLKRLDARPIATMSLEAQERKERMERVFRED